MGFLDKFFLNKVFKGREFEFGEVKFQLPYGFIEEGFQEFFFFDYPILDINSLVMVFFDLKTVENFINSESFKTYYGDILESFEVNGVLVKKYINNRSFFTENSLSIDDYNFKGFDYVFTVEGCDFIIWVNKSKDENSNYIKKILEKSFL